MGDVISCRGWPWKVYVRKYTYRPKQGKIMTLIYLQSREAPSGATLDSRGEQRQERVAALGGQLARFRCPRARARQPQQDDSPRLQDKWAWGENLADKYQRRHSVWPESIARNKKYCSLPSSNPRPGRTPRKSSDARDSFKLSPVVPSSRPFSTYKRTQPFLLNQTVSTYRINFAYLNKWAAPVSSGSNIRPAFMLK